MSVLAVIVSYYPDEQRLKRLVDLLCAQSNAVLVVDNTPATSDQVAGILKDNFVTNENLRIIRLGNNYGIAKALNVGIEVASTEGFSHVLLSDQDSIPDNQMIAGLLKAESDELYSKEIDKLAEATQIAIELV